MDESKNTTANPVNGQNGKITWKSSLCLVVLLYFYLIVGASMFRATERANTLVAEQEIRKRLKHLLTKNPCVTDVDISHFYNNVSYYLARGVSLRQRFRLDREGGELESIWTPTVSVAFALQVITTIGYGQIVPHTTTGRLFCMAYAMVGLPLMALTLSVFGRSLQGFTKKYMRTLDLLRKSVKQQRALLIVQIFITVCLLIITVVLFPSAIIAYFDNWRYFDAIYFYIITITTIGFGDMVIGDCSKCGPNSWLFFFVFMFSVLMGMGVISLLFSASSNYQKEKTLSVINYSRAGSATPFEGFLRRRNKRPVQVTIATIS
ncbi:Potassium channel subfamily K member 4 [Holothuria leucospilota]|uniref:Potassium channel subfamily K member 4 n=1 Tax=Holothuria leucospilota TaxID=206669 RepID=A0A9Q1HGX5_HOLLE|nr:Potassium channel subfamily K member 4 [Holothuria leucospilota]